MPSAQTGQVHLSHGHVLAYLGVSAPAIRDLLGRTQLSTPDVYLYSIPLEHVEAMRRMESLLGRQAQISGNE